MGVGASCPQPSCCNPEGPELHVVEAIASEARLEQAPTLQSKSERSDKLERGAISCTTLMDSIPDLPTRGTSTATVMSKGERHKQQRYSHVDMGVVRGMPLRKSLNGLGRVWRYNPCTWQPEDCMRLYNMSEKVTYFHVFLSHTWWTPGRWKFLSLSFQCGWHYGLIFWFSSVAICAALCLYDVLPMPLTYRATIMGFDEVCPMGFWIISCSCVATGLGLLSTPLWPERCSRSDIGFIDVSSIHQVDKKLMERGIFGIAGFLSISSELRILWSAPYLSRLWCVFEVAAYKKVNPTGRITFRPMFVERAVLGMLLSSHAFAFLILFGREMFYGNFVVLLFIYYVTWPVAICVLRLNFREKHHLLSQLENFDLGTVQCSHQFDRDFIHAAIEKWYGSKQAFVDFVRTDLRDELEKSLSRTRLPNQYQLLLLTPILSLSAEYFLAIWKAGAPSDALLSFAIGIFLGFDVCYLWASNLLMIYLCDVLAPRRFGYLDHVQTIFIIFMIVLILYLGSVGSAAAYQDSLTGACVFLGVSVLFVACMCWLEGRSVASLLRYCARRWSWRPDHPDEFQPESKPNVSRV